MSKVLDQDGNVVNKPAPQVAGKYEDAETSLVQDWYIQHPEEIGVSVEIFGRISRFDRS